MEIQLQRFSSNSESTLGLLFIDGHFVCYTLEDEYRAVKKWGETRIVAGRYRVVLRKAGTIHAKYTKRYKGMHQGMLHILNIPKFQWVYFHIGNIDDHTAGCILVGDRANNNKVADGKVSESTNAYKRFYPTVASAFYLGQRVWLTIEDEKKIVEVG